LNTDPTHTVAVGEYHALLLELKARRRASFKRDEVHWPIARAIGLRRPPDAFSNGVGLWRHRDQWVAVVPCIKGAAHREICGQHVNIAATLGWFLGQF